MKSKKVSYEDKVPAALNVDNLGIMVIGGEERVFQVDSMRQIKAFTTALGVEVDEFDKSLALLNDKTRIHSNAALIYLFIWSALFAGEWKTERTCSFTFDDVVDWIEDDIEKDPTSEELVKPINAFIEFRKKDSVAENYYRKQQANYERYREKYDKSYGKRGGNDSEAEESIQITWLDLEEYALGEIGLDENEFYDLTSLQYFYKDIHYKTKLAKRWEVERENMVFTANMNIAEKSKKLVATDLFYLITDIIPEKVSYAIDDEDNETDAEFYKRMAANNFYLPDIKNKDMNN